MYCLDVTQDAGWCSWKTSFIKEIDPEEEESKGGSGEVGKLLLSDGQKDFAMLAYVPETKVEKVRNTSEGVCWGNTQCERVCVNCIVSKDICSRSESPRNTKCSIAPISH